MIPFPSFGQHIDRIQARKYTALTKQVPRPTLYEVAFAKDALIPENEVEVLRVADDDAWRQGGDRDLQGLVAELAFTFNEPGE